MAMIIELPVLGQSMEEGTITTWCKKEGDTVAQGETLYEVMTDKANIEVESPLAGVLLKILVAADEIVPVKSPIAIIGAAGESFDGLPAGVPASAATPEPTVAHAVSESAASSSKPAADGDKVFASPRARRVAAELGISIWDLAGQGTGIDGRIVEADVLAANNAAIAARKAGKVSPLAQRVAEEHGVDLTALAGVGSGYGGKVTSSDVKQRIAGEAAPAVAPMTATSVEPLKVIPLTGMRRMIADNVARSAATAPHVTVTLGVDMFEATRFRAQILPSTEKTFGVRVTFTDIIAKAAARALVDHPMINSTLVNNVITVHRSVHLGIAVSLGEGGLVVPTVRDAQTKSLPDISREIKLLAGKGREGKLGIDEMTGGTFSITNLGNYGVEQFNPIINPPQCAILGVCAIKERTVAHDGGFAARPYMNLCLSFDHRIVNGAPASAFLARLKEILEQPYLMFT